MDEVQLKSQDTKHPPLFSNYYESLFKEGFVSTWLFAFEIKESKEVFKAVAEKKTLHYWSNQ